MGTATEEGAVERGMCDGSDWVEGLGVAGVEVEGIKVGVGRAGGVWAEDLGEAVVGVHI